MSHPVEIQWFVARYDRDLMRGEPRNIGVIVRPAKGLMEYRFLDLEDALHRANVRLGPNYEAWVGYWVNSIEKHGPKCVHWLTKRRQGENYFIAYGGSHMAPRVDVDELFDRLCGIVDPNEELPDEPKPGHWRK